MQGVNIFEYPQYKWVSMPLHSILADTTLEYATAGFETLNSIWIIWSLKNSFQSLRSVIAFVYRSLVFSKSWWIRFCIHHRCIADVVKTKTNNKWVQKGQLETSWTVSFNELLEISRLCVYCVYVSGRPNCILCHFIPSLRQHWNALALSLKNMLYTCVFFMSVQ